MEVRVRFAPSPTGHLHIGGARTALFNWLIARKNKGRFILRIEDTDEKRSSEEMVRGILDGLSWLGLDWDEGPYFQSDGLKRHRELALRLVEEGKAYRDFSDPGADPDSYLAFRDLSLLESDEVSASGKSFAIRFKVPADKAISFEDQVFGAIQVDSCEIADFVLLRSDGLPTYHLSVVADDIEMRISHVIRGADHLSNTSKHILLFEALCAEIPKFAHLPLIFGPDKKRLSKRHGATSVTEYQAMGFLPEAVRNYLALLGWSPGDDSEFFSEEELISRFDPARINKANAVFDISKLDWMNKRYISSTALENLVPEIRKRLVQEHLWFDGFEKGKREWFYRVLDLLRARATSLDDIISSGRAFFTDDFEYEEGALQKYSGTEDPDLRSTLREALLELKNSLASIEPFDEETTETILRSIGDKFALKTGLFIGAVRVATTGMGRAPGIFEVLTALGREKSVDRLNKFIRILE